MYAFAFAVSPHCYIIFACICSFNYR